MHQHKSYEPFFPKPEKNVPILEGILAGKASFKAKIVLERDLNY